MKKSTKLLAGAVAVAIGGLAMTSIASATTTVTPLVGETVNYTLNGNENFSAGVLQIDDGATKIFILDRNLGATAGTVCSNSDTGACGYYFQWGNNHGFHAFGNETATIQVDASGYGPGNWYSGGVFIGTFDDWSNPSNDNLWGGSTSDYISSLDGNNWKVNNASDRKGPCPESFHVPSYGELLKIKDMLGNNSTIMRNELALPLAGMINPDINPYIPAVGVSDMTSAFQLWSSSPCTKSGISCLYYDSYDDADMWCGQRRGFASSVRCVYDSYETYTPAGNFSSEGGDASGQVTLTLTAGENTCTLNDYNLGTHDASTVNQYVESSGQEIMCEFLQNTGVRVLLSMDNLADGEKIIGAENFTGIVTASGDALGSISNLIGGSYNLSGMQEIYRKSENTIGKWMGDLQIQGIIPAGTPSGTYTGTLEIVIQAGM